MNVGRILCSITKEDLANICIRSMQERYLESSFSEKCGIYKIMRNYNLFLICAEKRENPIKISFHMLQDGFVYRCLSKHLFNVCRVCGNFILHF
jgi:hypothetical protein